MRAFVGYGGTPPIHFSSLPIQTQLRAMEGGGTPKTDKSSGFHEVSAQYAQPPSGSRVS